MSIQQAFNEILEDVQPAQVFFVSLYSVYRWYGGAEEGGWWGNTVSLVAHKEFRREDEAKQALAAIEALAKEKSHEAKQAHYRLCEAQLDYCEQRGIDDANSVFGEVDGADEYHVQIETELGSGEYSTSRYYE